MMSSRLFTSSLRQSARSSQFNLRPSVSLNLLRSSEPGQLTTVLVTFRLDALRLLLLRPWPSFRVKRTLMYGIPFIRIRRPMADMSAHLSVGKLHCHSHRGRWDWARNREISEGYLQSCKGKKRRNVPNKKFTLLQDEFLTISRCRSNGSPLMLPLSSRTGKPLSQTRQSRVFTVTSLLLRDLSL